MAKLNTAVFPALWACSVRARVMVLAFFGLIAVLLPASAQAQNLCVGNLVFVDADSNGRYDFNEGIGNIRVEMWRVTGDPEQPEVMTAALTTQSSGFYLFQGLAPGTYFVKIPESEFAANKPLAGMLSVPGSQLLGDDDAGEDGLDSFDPVLTGVSTMPFVVTGGFGPTGSEESGFGGTIDDLDDANADMTIDFGFYKPVGVGNLVFADMNGNGRADAGEGVSGVVVQLYHAADDVTQVSPLADVITDAGGFYQFGALPAGNYKLHVPATQFASGGPLEGALSVDGAGLTTDDDDANSSGQLGDDGIDSPNPDIHGISSGEIVLVPGTEPTAGTGETGADSASDDIFDTDIDLTVDFGFVFPPNQLAVGNLVFEDYNDNGHYDDGEGTLGVKVQLFAQGQNPATESPIAERTTKSDGSYFFGSVAAGSYFLHVPASEFAPGKPLFSALSVENAANGDDDAGEDGLDVAFPEFSGVSTAVFDLVAGALPTDSGLELGYNYEADNFRDEFVDLTHDFGFRVRAREPLSVGNLVFLDEDQNGRLNGSEVGISNVTVQLFRQGDNPASASPVAIQQTASNGTYLFTGLVPGRYFLHVPAAEFANGQPLFNLRSSPGNGQDDNSDDGVNENGMDAAGPPTTGVSSNVFELAENLEPIEDGFASGADDADDNNGDLTIDLGFSSSCPVLAIFPASLPAAQAEASYSQTLTIQGDSGVITWALLSGSLPSGITLSASGTLSGTTSATGSFSFTVQATTEQLCTVTNAYTLEVEQPMNLGVGNLVFVDSNGNGKAEDGEGVANVTLQLFGEGVDPAVGVPLRSTVTDSVGRYAFQTLPAGRYFVHVKSENFGPGGALVDKVSRAGTGGDKPRDDDKDENGIDVLNPASTGVSSSLFQLSAGSELTDAAGEIGLYATEDNAFDSNFDATVDFAFIPSPLVSVGLGNVVFRDDNANNVFDEGEGISGVTVQLYFGSDDVTQAAPLRSTTTASGGRYSFMGLSEGTYRVFIPASQFAPGAPLYGCRSVEGAGADAAGDDDVDENGIDVVDAAATGVQSGTVVLQLNAEPQNLSVEHGAGSTADDAADANADLTVDMGFVRNCSTITISPDALPEALVGTSYSTQFLASGGTAPHVFTFAFGELPPGLILETNGVLTGTPTAGGVYEFAVQAADDYGCFVIKEFSIQVISPPLGVGNLVFFDANDNGHADAGEGVDGVTVELYLDSDTPGAGAPLASTATASGGRYLFDELDAGSYQLHIPASMFAVGAPLWKMLSMSGVLNDTDDDAGEDSQDALDPSATGVTITAFTLQPGQAPSGNAELGLSGDSDIARDGDIDLTRDFGFVDQTDLPSTYVGWAGENGLNGTNNGATSNPDGDDLSNLLEYALGGSPTSGAATSSFQITENQLTGQVDVALRRRHGGLGDLTYQVQVLKNLAQIANGWTDTQITPTITNNGDGTETLVYGGIETDPALSTQGFGFVRVLVSLDANHDTVAEASDFSPIQGWNHRRLEVRNQTYAVPFVPAPLFTGTAGTISSDSIDLSASAGTANINSLFVAGREYYLEALSGTHEGHRWEVDEAGSANAVITLLPSHQRSTQTIVPANLTGTLVALRVHWRIIDLFPVSDFQAASNPNTADTLLFWDNTARSYIGYWLANTPQGKRWLKVGDATLTIQNDVVVGPCDGLFTRPKAGAIEALSAGLLRTWKVACPLKAGANLVGNPYPVAQSFNDRGMSTANGFIGSNNALNAEKVNVWLGDATSSAHYDGYFLLKNGSIERWLKSGDATATDQGATPIFAAGLAAYIHTLSGKSNWVLSAPWTP